MFLEIKRVYLVYIKGKLWGFVIKYIYWFWFLDGCVFDFKVFNLKLVVYCVFVLDIFNFLFCNCRCLFEWVNMKCV